MIIRITLFLFFYCVYLNAQIDTEKFVRLNVHLNGVIKAENRIIIYGNNGSLLISEDNSNTWKQESINDSIHLFDLSYSNGRIKGIVTSVNTSNIYNLEYDISSKKYKLENLYIPIKLLIQTFIKNNIRYLNASNEIYSFNETTKEVKLLLKDTLLKFSYFTLIDKYLVIPTLKDTVIRINLENNIKEYLPTFGLNMKFSKIVNFKNKLYYVDYARIFKSEDYGQTWDSIAQMNSGELFVSNFDYLFLSYTNSKYEKEIIKVSDDGISFNFNQSKKLEFKGVIEKLSIRNVFNVDKNIDLAIGWDKLILKSDNSKNNWSLVSNINRKQYDVKIKFFDENYGFAFTDYNQFYITFDGGVTWKPTNEQATITLGGRKVYSGYNYFGNDGSAFYINDLAFSDVADNLVYSLDTCKTFNFSSINLKLFQGCSNILKFKDSIYFAIKAYDKNNNYFKLYTLDSKFNITNIKQFDSLIIYKIFVDNENKLEMICSESKYHNDKYNGNVQYYYDSTKVVIKVLDGNNNIWKDKFILPDLNHHLIRDLIVLKDKILFLSGKLEFQPKVPDTNSYLYEIRNEKVNLINLFSDKSVGYFTNFNNKTYLGGTYRMYYQNEKSDWNSQLMPVYLGGRNNPFFGFEKSFIVATKSTQNSDASFMNIYKYEVENSTNIVNSEIEDFTDLITLLPSPLPANNFTKIGVLWSPIYSFNISNLEVYNIYGIKVKCNLNTTLREFDFSRGELTIQTDELNDGIYFIKISHGITTKYVKILVEH